VTALYLDPLSASIFQGAIRGLALSTPITVAITLRQSSGAPVYNPATGTTIYPETITALTAFRAVVTEKQANERIQAGSVRWDFDKSTVTDSIKTGDRVVDADGVVWSVYEIGDPDPTQSLARVYTRRSSEIGK
jgi:hypothetical protein